MPRICLLLPFALAVPSARCLSRLHSHLGLRVLHHAHSVPCGCSAGIPVFLLVVGRQQPLGPTGHPQVQPCGPHSTTAYFFVTSYLLQLTHALAFMFAAHGYPIISTSPLRTLSPQRPVLEQLTTQSQVSAQGKLQ